MTEKDNDEKQNAFDQGEEPSSPEPSADAPSDAPSDRQQYEEAASEEETDTDLATDTEPDSREGEKAKPTGIVSTPSAETRQRGPRPSRRTLNREQRRQRSSRRRARKRFIYGVLGSSVALVLILGLALPSFAGLFTPTPTEDEPSVGTQVEVLEARTLEEGETFDSYSTPPTSGPSYAEGIAWGIHETQQPSEAVVRNLREGAIVINHNLGDQASVDSLLSVVDNLPGFPACYVVHPFEGIEEGRITLTAWGWMQSFETVDRNGMRAFIDDHRNEAPVYLGVDCGFSESEMGS